MAEGLKYHGATGVVIDGAARDLQEYRDLEFPVSYCFRHKFLSMAICHTRECPVEANSEQVFARKTGTSAGGAVFFLSEINVPVKLQSPIQDATVHPGDYIIADTDGTVCLPVEVAKDVREIVPVIATADRRCGAAIRAGMSVKEAFATYRAT